MISERERRWVERMQAAGLFPRPPAAVTAEPAPEGGWRMTGYGDGMVLVQINKVAMSSADALEVCRLAGVERVSVEIEQLSALMEKSAEGS